MGLGGSWVYCADDDGSNNKLVIVRKEGEEEKIEEFDGMPALRRLRDMLNIDKKITDICNETDCKNCPVAEVLPTGVTCYGWVMAHIDKFLKLYEKWRDGE